MKRTAPSLTPVARDQADPRRRTRAKKTLTRTLSVVALAALFVAAPSVSERQTRARHAPPNVIGADASEFSQCVQEPAVASTFVVNSTSDGADADAGDGLCLTATPGECTLRAAIQQANANPDADTINFLIPAATDANCAVLTGVCTISPASALPAVTAPLTIDGYTQPGSAANTLAVGDDADINIELEGASAGTGADGLNISAGDSTVRGLAVYGFAGDGIELNTEGSNTVTGNFIGTNATGTAAALGNGGDGVRISNVASNTVGGPAPSERNVICANGVAGVDINGGGATLNAVAGNYIGTDRNGTADLGNGVDGVFISGPSNTVGGSTPTPGQGAGNVIGGNGSGAVGSGVRISAGGNNNAVVGNLVGLAAGGAAALGNSNNGVLINNAAAANTVGGATAGLRNVISSNNGAGVSVGGAGTTANKVQGNYIGTDATGTLDRGNTSDGVLINAGATANAVGGLTATPGTAPGNVISGNNSDGVEINTGAASPLNNTVQGNLVGTSFTGLALLRNDSNGVFVSASSNNLVGGPTAAARNVITGGVAANSDAIDFQLNSDGNTVSGNYIGTKIDGTGANGGADDFGAGQDGVRLTGDGDNNTIGGPATTPGAAPGNVIAGHASNGVEINGPTAGANKVQGNLIGTQADGATAYANGAEGVLFSGSPTNSVGGPTATPGTGLGNVISGNTSDGVELNNADSTLVQGNLVGLAAGGAAALANGAHGIHLNGSASCAVGGVSAGAANVIAFNGGDGVFIPSGVNVNIRRNSIHSNAGLGIDLGADGVTPNDTDDADAGANNLQNFPSVSDARTGSTVIKGTLNSTPSTVFTVEFFSSATPDPTAHGEGQTFLDSVNVTTDAGGDATFTHTVAATVAPGRVITATATNPSGDTSEFSASRVVLAPTAARLRSFTASASPEGVNVEWQTSFEIDNLGFNLYREQGGARTLLTPSPVAGSALLVGERTALAAGNSYEWFDAGALPSARYWLEEIDLGGATKTHGPFWPTAMAARRVKPRRRTQPTLLDQLGSDGRTPSSSSSAQHQWPVTLAGRQTSPLESAPVTFDGSGPLRQRDLAAKPAVKLHVRRGGWYRVTRAELEAAGLSPAADPSRLQLYADSIEQRVRLDEAAWKQGGGAVEFYGEGLDTPSTDTRVYWLVEGDRAGLRLGASNVSEGGGFISFGGGTTTNPPATFNGGGRVEGGVAANGGGIIAVDLSPIGGGATATGFPYTLELRERAVYFSSLLNGEKENFFGRVVSATPLRQQLDVRHLDAQDPSTNSNPPRLEVALQGATAVAHNVSVFLNDERLGVVQFAGREHRVESFNVPPWKLRDGANEVRLTSGAANDVSLTDYLRLSYRRQYRAEGDALRFTAEGNKTVRAVGFTTPDVRVLDITDPLNVSDVPSTVTPMNDAEGRGYAVNVAPLGFDLTRTLYACAGASASRVEAATANRPSDWHESREADFVIIAHGDFLRQSSALAARRSAEGLATEVVNVEDLYDEFSHGAHSPRAVKDFLAWAAVSWARAPRFVLLVGDGSYDPRDYTARGRFDLVPAKLVDTAYMETASDAWFADFDGDGLSEMAVGRLPLRTADEAALVVSKIVNHEPDASGGSALMVADRRGADGYDFEAATDAVQSLLPAAFNVTRVNRGARDANTVRAQIVGGINDGPSIVNWMGHGSINVWTGEGLLRSEDAGALSNGGRLPLFVMMTCLNGYFQDPSLESLSESLLKASRGGALAVWTSTGMTEPAGQAAMNRELFGALFGAGAGPLRLGEAMQRARSATSDADVRRTWVLIGDPTTRVR